ncbi:ADP-ribosylglycohydrolase [Gregarina niphandrodes]|uniref:ADP-ribosylglycohydrolase n=1 Tax=Gregarina niphandrodes TaxID=110365 RepID=A0A023BA75_GRENI|nr:ADP-ribosylglycohydrolase [Gregarina niphandrodes]EZG78143.1 ADP-ribosylglycohydrolase [Gregarina niphandrodes]|eukprot:XP_011129457.1 ADP-ribosylglycohydrolase [Gregarina niphandrodes]
MVRSVESKSRVDTGLAPALVAVLETLSPGGGPALQSVSDPKLESGLDQATLAAKPPSVDSLASATSLVGTASLPSESAKNLANVSEPCGVCSTEVRNRAVGCLLGQFVGDALGTRYEFSPGPRAAAKVAGDMRDGLLPILGGGPFALERGQVTDDTELAMALAATLRDGRYDRAAAAAAYKGWLDSGPFDVGNATRNAFAVNPGSDPSSDPSSGPSSGERLETAMLEQARLLNGESLSNGCLMRASPLALVGAGWSEVVLLDAARADCELSNPHVDAQAAVAAYVAGLRALVGTGDVSCAMERAKAAASSSKLVQGFLSAAERGEQVVQLPDGSPAVVDGQHMGYLGVALQWGFDQLLHARSFHEGLVEIVRRGGDTDTNGCIAAALLGARFGSQAVPRPWTLAVITCKQKRLGTFPQVDSRPLTDTALNLLARGAGITTGGQEAAIEHKAIEHKAIEHKAIEHKATEHEAMGFSGEEKNGAETQSKPVSRTMRRLKIKPAKSQTTKRKKAPKGLPDPGCNLA